MMTVQLLLALLIVVAPAWVWLQRLVPAGLPARGILVSGYSVILGAVVIGLIMRCLSGLSVPFSVFSVGAASLCLSAAGALLPAGWRNENRCPFPQAESGLSNLQRLFVVLCLLLLAARLMSLGLEVATRPVTSWDAKQHWTKQARVFYEHLRVVPYVSLQDWLDLGGRGVYTNMHPGYPITAPLLQAWIAVAIGAWHESLVNLPWLAVWVAMGMVFYSQARIAGGSIGLAIGATYMVLSMPYMNIHVALAGYADLFMAASYLGAVASLYNWSRTRASWLLYLGLITGASCMLFKNEGFYWFMSLIPGILLVLLGVRRGLLVLASMLLLLLLFVALMPVETVVAGHSLAGLDIRYRPESWFPLYLSFFVHGNWHFLAYLVLLAMAAVPLFAREALPLAVVVMSALLLYLALYLFTSNATGAVYFTSLNRVGLHIMPAASFLVFVVLMLLLRRGSEPQPEQAIA